MKNVSDKLKCVLQKGKIIADKKENPYWRVYISNGYGEEKEDFIELDPIEALHLLEKKKIVIKDEKNGSKIGKKELFALASKRPDFWLDYLIYKDLRTRGYPVKLAKEKPLILHVYDRGVRDVRNEKPVFSVLPTEAARELKVIDLSNAMRISKELGTSLVIGIVDELGEVVYYDVVEEILEKEG